MPSFHIPSDSRVSRCHPKRKPHSPGWKYTTQGGRMWRQNESQRPEMHISTSYFRNFVPAFCLFARGFAPAWQTKYQDGTFDKYPTINKTTPWSHRTFLLRALASSSSKCTIVRIKSKIIFMSLSFSIERDFNCLWKSLYILMKKSTEEKRNF